MITKIGYWYDPNAKTVYPMPVPNSASENQIHQMLGTLTAASNKAETLYCKGFSTCRICHEPNGSEELCWLFNGNDFRIPSGLLHYITEHKVLVADLLPGGVLDSALKTEFEINSHYGFDKI